MYKLCNESSCGSWDKECGAREIQSTDQSIDRLVYELSHKGMIYGLTDEEIKIVEGKE